MPSNIRMRLNTPAHSADEHEQRAIFLAAVCGQTYSQYLNEDGSFIVPVHYQLHDIIEAKSITHIRERFGFILESPQEIIIAFRGTISTTDWISDLIASQKRFNFLLEDTLTHRGFTDIYASARAGIFSSLSTMSQDKSLFITGHSLGAALATLCAADIAANTPFISPSLYTYGSPRVGDPDFAYAFNKHVIKSYRFSNITDLVTYVPPIIYKLPKREQQYYYRHVQTLASMTFNNGSASANHVIGSYFAQLAKLQPLYSKTLSEENPGFCPVAEIV
ncbi:lipase family protein [Paenibacillus dakarensis]|uniref:lipase family protein n=1 Tax=Paenibacillus dakarensis TaxID=1527293 RepID=UPI000B1DBD6C|nr:lipase family protein [Paenibacillus dakarensis]